MTEPAHTDQLKILEALLCASAEALAADRLAKILQCSPREVSALATALNAEYTKTERAFEITHTANGYQLRTRPHYQRWIAQLSPAQKPVLLSRAALETLAVIAYRQPVTRLEIERLRGVDSVGSLRSLLDKHLIRVAGRDHRLGRPILYRTTPQFLANIGLKQLTDMPALEEFQHQAQLPLGE